MKKLPYDKISGTKNPIFFLLRDSTHHRFTFNLLFLYELKHISRLSKTVTGIFYFRLRFVLLKFIFLFNRMHELFDFKRSKLKQWKSHRHFAPRPLTFKLQQKVLEFNHICVGWSS